MQIIPQAQLLHPDSPGRSKQTALIGDPVGWDTEIASTLQLTVL